MTLYEFCVLLVAANIAYCAGDALYALGSRKGRTALLRVGCLLVAAALGTLVAMAVILFGG